MRVIRTLPVVAMLIAATALAAPTTEAKTKALLSADITGGSRNITIIQQDDEWLEFREEAEINVTGVLAREPVYGTVRYGYHARVQNVPDNPDYPGYPKMGGALEQYAEVDINGMGWADEQTSPFAVPIQALECTNGFADCLDEHAILLAFGPGLYDGIESSTGVFVDLKVNQTWTIHVVTSANGDTIEDGTITGGVGRDFMYALAGTQDNAVLDLANGVGTADVHLSTTEYWGADDGRLSVPISGGPLQIEYNLVNALQSPPFPPFPWADRDVKPESRAAVFNDGGVMSGYLQSMDVDVMNGTLVWSNPRLVLDDLSGVHSAYQLAIMHVFVNQPVGTNGPVTGGMWGLLAQY